MFDHCNIIQDFDISVETILRFTEGLQVSNAFVNCILLIEERYQTTDSF